VTEDPRRSCTSSSTWTPTPSGSGSLTACPTLATQADQQAREFGLSHLDAAVAGAARQPAGTLMLRSDKLTPAELADGELARAHG
jgi:hypothetical protein